MFRNLEIVFIMCCFAGTSGQNNNCLQIDFDNENSFLEFEACEDLKEFAIQSYADVSIEPFRSDAENHLSNIGQVGFLCLRAQKTLNLTIYTEIDSLIYLNSNTEDMDSYVEILAFDTEEGGTYTVGDGEVGVSTEWNIYHEIFSRDIEYAKVNDVGCFSVSYLNRFTVFRLKFMHTHPLMRF